jgi:hypothetical protein
MRWLLIAVLPVTVFAALDLLCRGESPAVLRRLGRLLRRLRGRLARSFSPADARRPGPTTGDVFDTLRVQSRLGAVAGEILRLESDGSVFARASRLRATRRAYDDLLTEACRLAEVPPESVGLVDCGLLDAGPVPGARSGDDLEVRVRNSDAARAEAEFELASRGWSW